MEYAIRNFDITTDIPDTTRLTVELGYPTTEELFQKRMATIITVPDYYTFVACDNNKVIGYIGTARQYFWEQDGTFFKIQALVVKQEYRKMGVGAALLQHVEKLAREQGASLLLLNSGNRPEREAAHRFYLDMGFEIKSTGFRKALL